MDETNVLIIIVVTLLLLIGVSSLAHYADTQILEIKEGLGGSICDQEYNMNFDTYDDGELTCKPKVIVEQEQYDGIVIKIKEAR